MRLFRREDRRRKENTEMRRRIEREQREAQHRQLAEAERTTTDLEPRIERLRALADLIRLRR